jgi:tetratricopeptide (TPR) repeat protein
MCIDDDVQITVRATTLNAGFENFEKIFGVSVEVFKKFEDASEFVDHLPAETKAVLDKAEELADVTNNSVASAKTSGSVKTRKYEIAIARARIFELQRLAARHPFVRVDHVEEMMVLIHQIELDTAALRYQDNAGSDEIGRELEGKGKIAQAIAAYEGLVQKLSENPHVYKRLAILYRRVKSMDDEARVLVKALRNVPESNKKHYEWFRNRLNKIRHRDDTSS